MADFAIGVDLGGTNLRIAAVDDSGRLLEKVTTGTQVALGRDHVINEMCEAILHLAMKFQASSSSLRGIGIGVPGIIDMSTGMVYQSPNLPDWRDYPVRDEIEGRLNTRVILENDANSAAMGEKWLGAARDATDMAMLTLGTGVGGGLVINDRIWHGMTGMANEFGHTTVDPHGPPCPCGNVGCVEQFASAKSIVRMANEAIRSGTAPQLQTVASSDPEFSAKAVYNLAIQGDKPAQEIFHRVGQALGIALATLINGLNLPMYVIGGGVASAWDAFAPAMLAELRWRSMVYAATNPDEPSGSELSDATAQVPARASGQTSGQMPSGSLKRTIVTRALLGSDAGLYGAARLPMLPEEARATTARSERLRA
jgi:glucokinase